MSFVTRPTLIIGYPTMSAARELAAVESRTPMEASVSSRSSIVAADSIDTHLPIIPFVPARFTADPVLPETSSVVSTLPRSLPLLSSRTAVPAVVGNGEIPTELQLFWKRMGFQPGDCISRQYSKNIVYWGQKLTGRGRYACNTHIAIFLEPTKDKVRILEAMFDRVRVVERDLSQFKEYVGEGLDVISSGEAPCKRALDFLEGLAKNTEVHPVHYNYMGFLYAPFLPSSSCMENAGVGMETLRKERLITFDGWYTRFAICSDVGVKVLTAFQIAQQAAKEGLHVVKLETVRLWQKTGKVLDRDSLLTTPAALVKALRNMPGQRLRKLDQIQTQCAIDMSSIPKPIHP